MLIPLAFNELLGRPSLKSFNLYSAFDLQLTSTLLPLFERSGITPELRCRAHGASSLQSGGWHSRYLAVISNDLLGDDGDGTNRATSIFLAALDSTRLI